MRHSPRRFSLPSRERVRILLDTQVWLWMLGEPARLTAGGRARLRSPGNTFYVSAASIWEIVIKHAAGKLRPPDEPVACLRGRLAETPAGIAREHLLRMIHDAGKVAVERDALYHTVKVYP